MVNKKHALPVIVIALFLLQSFLAFAQDSEENYLFNEWVTEGDTFEVSGLSVYVMGGEVTDSAILMFPQKTIVVSEGSCSRVDSLEVCLDDWEYVKGGEVRIHGEDKHKYLIKVKVPGPELEIERDAEQPIIEVGGSTKVSVIIRNNGDKAALGLYYTETIPEEFEITNTNKLTQTGSKLEWRGSIPANGYAEMEYNLLGKSSFSGKIDAFVEYDANGRKLYTSDTLGLKVTSPLEITAKLDKWPMKFKEENRVYVTIKNKRTSDAAVSVSARFPSSFYIVASHLNSTASDYYAGGGTVEGGEEVTYITRFRADAAGDFRINISATGKFADKTVTESKSVNVSVELDKAEIYFIHGDVYLDEEARIKLYLKNTNSYVKIVDVDTAASCPYFNRTSYSASFNPGEYNELFSVNITPAEKGKFRIYANVSYTAAGKKYKVAASEEIEVKERKNATEPAMNKTAENVTLPLNASNQTNGSEEMAAEEEAGMLLIVPDTSMIESLYSYGIMADSIRKAMDGFREIYRVKGLQ